MMNNNKILTVSYGTFSCTLEGFDDSFGTMKVIAEYFRDLAADDRYFGAEPPQPDVEMLTRLAEKEVLRRVQGREKDGKIVLSAYQDQIEQAEGAIGPQEQEAPYSLAEQQDDVAEAAIAGQVAKAAAEEAKEAAEAEAAKAAQEAAEAEAAKAAQEAAEAEAAKAAQEAAEAEAAKVAQEAAEAEAAKAAQEAAAIEDENDIVPGQPDAEVEAFFADASSPVEITSDGSRPLSVSKAAADTSPAPDSIAAKLQRIRAVVAQHEEAEENDDYLEDQHANGKVSEDSNGESLLKEARSDIEDALNLDEESISDSDALDAVMARVKSEAEAASSDASADPAPAGDVEKVNNLFDDGEAKLFEIDQSPAQPKRPLRRASQRVVVEKSKPADSPRKPDAPRARVIKVKRVDLDAAIKKGDLEEYDDYPTQGPKAETPKAPPALDDLAPARKSKTALSPEDEADLARELLELEGEMDAAKPASTPRNGAARELLPSIDDGQGADVNRLLAETDHQMDEPESATRRDAFAHLRAAVAAKKADATINTGAGQEDGDNAYRNDLAEVVRPRRPVASASRSERPEDSRPAPLKLVAEQRIDVQPSAAATPVRPRRVSATATPVAAAQGDESFSEFAEEMGAQTLPQLLEAAAAYMSYVEGLEQFSRPQLMTKVRQIDGQDEFSREEGLRSFGQLLRSGKIEKIKGGRFTASESISYRPDQRAAG